MANAVIRIREHEVEVYRRSRQRHMNLSVRPNGRLRVSCNRSRTMREISTFVLASETFISRRLAEIATTAAKFPPRRFISGELFLYRGARLELQLIWTWRARTLVKVLDQTLEMLTPLGASFEDRRKSLAQFYRSEARAIFADRIEFWSERMGLRANSLSVRGQRTLWGSCSGPGDISLNFKLLCAPMAVIDYVVVHELAHIRERNHSVQFWSLVEDFVPSWREHRDWLKAHEPEISRMFAIPANLDNFRHSAEKRHLLGLPD